MNFSNARRTSSGVANMTVFDWSDDKSFNVLSVRRWSAPACAESVCAASARFCDAATSPSDLMITARRSRSASACLAITRCMSSGKITSFNSTASTLIPHGSVAASTICFIFFAAASRFANKSSNSNSPTTFLIVVCASCETANLKCSTSRTAFGASMTL